MKCFVQRFLGFLMMTAAGVAVANDAATLRNDTGWSNGLVVVYGPAELALDLGKDGLQLVAWFSSDVKAVSQMREKILAAGLQGIVTADVCAPGKIPLRGELANVVAVDADAVGQQAPGDAEWKRVLVPGGSLYRKQSGKWTDTKMPARPEYGAWTHLNANASGNPATTDSVADLPRGLQWLGPDSGVNYDPTVSSEGMLMQMPLVRKSYRGTRPPDEVILPGYRERFQEGKGMSAKPYLGGPSPIVGADPFNGLPRWESRNLRFDTDSWALLGRQAWFALPENVDRWGRLQGGVSFTAFDLRTGARGPTLEDAPQLVAGEKHTSWKRTNKPAQIVADNGRVYVAGDKRVVASDASTGKKLWQVDAEGALMSLPTLSPDGRHLYCLDAETIPAIIRYFGQRQVRHLVCIATATGKVLWRVPAIENQVSHMIGLDDGVLVGRISMHGWNVDRKGYVNQQRQDNSHQYRSGVDRYGLDGKIVWSADGIGSSGNNMVLVDRKIYVSEHFSTVRIDLATGKADRYAHPNVGCQRMFGLRDGFANANLLVLRWPEEKRVPSWTYVGITHPDCGQGFVVANGRFYVASNFMCGCNRMLRMSYALHCEQPPEPDADSTRLRPGTEIAAPVKTLLRPRDPKAATLLTRYWQDGYYGRPGAYWAIVPVREDDTLLDEPTKEGEVVFVPRVHSQRLEARRGDELLWAQQLGGRPAGQPVVVGKRVIQACRDGYVYAFDAATGEGAWRFLAARTDRRLVNAAQVESVWPCTNVIRYKDVIAVATGILPDTDGGGMLWGLDPTTGAIRWRVALQTSPLEGVGDEARNYAKYQGYHSNGRGFPIQRIREWDGKLMLGQWQTHNFRGSANCWFWLPVDISQESFDPTVAFAEQKVVREYEDGSFGPLPEWAKPKAK